MDGNPAGHSRPTGSVGYPYPTGVRRPGMVTLRVTPTLQDQGLPGSQVGPGCGVDCGPPEPEVGLGPPGSPVGPGCGVDCGPPEPEVGLGPLGSPVGPVPGVDCGPPVPEVGLGPLGLPVAWGCGVDGGSPALVVVFGALDVRVGTGRVAEGVPCGPGVQVGQGVGVYVAEDGSACGPIPRRWRKRLGSCRPSSIQLTRSCSSNRNCINAPI